MRLITGLLFLLTLNVAMAQTDIETHPNYLFRSVYFSGGSHYVDSLQRAELYQFIDSIPNIELYQFSIHSHTDDIGGAEYNAWLSQMRSEAVINELLNKKINPNTIVIRDFGMFNPVYDNNSPMGRRRNRRVDIIFWPLVL
jgi:outer membrane protein OmpA-like peptidoglycan-associated protein